MHCYFSTFSLGNSHTDTKNASGKLAHVVALRTASKEYKSRPRHDIAQTFTTCSNLYIY